MKRTIKTWAEDDRPREKLLHKGRHALSDAELIAPLTPTPPVTTKVPVDVLELATFAVKVVDPLAAKVVNAPVPRNDAPMLTLLTAPGLFGLIIKLCGAMLIVPPLAVKLPVIVASVAYNTLPSSLNVT